MPQQGSFSQAEYASKKKQTRRDKFLAEMEQVVPWPRLVARLRRSTRKANAAATGGVGAMLRIHFLQQWYALADPAMEEALYDSRRCGGLPGLILAVDAVPDETTILNFRHWLERHDLSRSLFEEVSAMLEERGLLMRQGTIVDATIIAAPSSTKNSRRARPGDASDQEGQPVVLRHEGAYRGRCRQGPGAHGGRHRSQRSRHRADGRSAARQGEDVFGDAGYNGVDKRPELKDCDVSWNGTVLLLRVGRSSPPFIA